MMSAVTIRLFAVMMLGAPLAVSSPAEADVMPWSYTPVSGYGSGYGYSSYNYGVGYLPMFQPMAFRPISYRAMTRRRANYARRYSSYYGPGMVWAPAAAPMTNYYGPSYYGGGAVYSGSNYSGSNCGCNPCGTSACSPCGGNSKCPSGNCSTSGGNYSPEPVKSNTNNDPEVTPTFKPTTPNKPPTPDPADDFVPVDRREDEFVSPRSTVPTTPSTIPTTPSTIPSTGANPASTIPMSPTARPVAPVNGIDSTIPSVNDRSTIPNPSGSTVPRSTIPETPVDRPFPPPISRPAPTDVSPEPLVPSTSVEPLEELELIPVAQLVIERKRVSMRAGYRIPAVSRIEVATDRVMEAGSSNLAIR